MGYDVAGLISLDGAQAVPGFPVLGSLDALEHPLDLALPVALAFLA